MISDLLFLFLLFHILILHVFRTFQITSDSHINAKGTNADTKSEITLSQNPNTRQKIFGKRLKKD